MDSISSLNSASLKNTLDLDDIKNSKKTEDSKADSYFLEKDSTKLDPGFKLSTADEKDAKYILDTIDAERRTMEIKLPKTIKLPEINDTKKVTLPEIYKPLLPSDKKFDDVSDEDKESIDNLVEGDKELNGLKEETKEQLKEAGLSDEEIENVLKEVEDHYLEDNPKYAKAKEKFGDLEAKHDAYIKEKMEAWAEKNPVPDYNASKEEWDRYYEKREEYEATLNNLYKLENPEYAYYQYAQNRGNYDVRVDNPGWFYADAIEDILY